MEPLAGKSDAIRSVITQLRASFGSKVFNIIDWWPDTPDLIGIARPGEDEPVVCILTFDKAEGRFDVEHGDTVYRDCVIQGVVWAVQQELRRRI